MRIHFEESTVVFAINNSSELNIPRVTVRVPSKPKSLWWKGPRESLVPKVLVVVRLCSSSRIIWGKYVSVQRFAFVAKSYAAELQTCRISFTSRVSKQLLFNVPKLPSTVNPFNPFNPHTYQFLPSLDEPLQVFPYSLQVGCGEHSRTCCVEVRSGGNMEG